MCGIVGWFDLSGRPVDPAVLARMTATLTHRGPDACGSFSEGGAALGFRRLSIIDLATGDQPLYNEDRSLVLVCNGEIYNYRELTRELTSRGHVFRTKSDVEVLLHLYEEEGCELLHRLNGQWSFALYDRRRRTLFAARDPYGINPLFYTRIGDLFLLASEIKALLEHPLVPREVDLTGLDQILTFPGLVPPRTVFQGVSCLESGHFLKLTPAGLEKREYWDLVYPEQRDAGPEEAESLWVDGLRERLESAVGYRLQADVPVGFYLSGGLDSSLVGALIGKLSPEPRHSFSITFPDREISEQRHQRLMAGILGSHHHEIPFGWEQIHDRLGAMVYHCECPVKESYDACALALSEAARAAGVPVVLAGQGADELFAGYPGYRFDQARRRETASSDADALLEQAVRETVWGDPDLFYETDFLPLREVKSALYASDLAAALDEFECVRQPVVRADRLRGRHPVHQRSYLDFKLRLSEHLLSEHGDRMVLANSVEGRYPFLDPGVVELAVRMPPRLKLNQLVEKYVVKKAAEGLVPAAVIQREKFGFRAPSTPYLLSQRVEWIEDLLSYERIQAQGYFNPDTVERLKERYRRPGFQLNAHLETDLLMIVLTFGILLERYRLPALCSAGAMAC
ncbi:MAG TPA: asparagine synthase (glutamine-hydrolyzing) [Thermoanaerobaculia bacterium]|jgi:asparagine synthase (glutamine-hydrolysing)|nr:asparagine synthase (glutamine-hydrolyzing) [Thermoanaerobaculia bacterium]